MSWGKRLKIPIGRAIRLDERVRREEIQAWASISCSHDDNIPFDELFATWTTSGDAFSTAVEQDAFLRKVLDVAAQPLRLSSTDFVHDIRVDHGCSSEDAFVSGCEIF